MLPDRVSQLLDSGELVAASLPLSDGLRRWIGVYPFKFNPETGMSTLNAPMQPWRYRIRCFGLSPEFDYDDYDLHEEYLTFFEDAEVKSLAEVEGIVARWLEDIEDLDYPQRCDFPL